MKLILSVFIIVISFNTFAWGPTGHRVVGEIAQRHLTKKAQIGITKILGKTTLARAATWPDEIKSDKETYGHTFNWHYTDWPNHKNEYDAKNNSGTLIKSIDEQIAVIKSKKTSKDKKIFALKFLVHLLGDLHMPLHVGNGSDLGGNLCKVIFHNEEVNLHKLWDIQMIKHSRLSFTEIVNFLDIHSKDKIKKFQEGKTLDWAKESKELREKIYPIVKKPSEVKTPPKGVQWYCQKDLKVSNDKLPQLGFPYTYKFMPILEMRLTQAGYRLAKTINNIFK